MPEGQHPWIAQPPASEVPTSSLPPIPRSLERPVGPQPGVPIPDSADRLPRHSIGWPATLWWVGAHGGAGESTLAQLLTGSRSASHAWPISDDPAQPAPVVVVARTSYGGLRAARLALTEWASGTVPVNLVGLVTIADAPGRLPKSLRDLSQIVSGGAPHAWHVPWVDAWRLGQPVTLDTAPSHARSAVEAIRTLLDASTPL